MGSLIGGLIGGVGSLFGGGSSQSSANAGAQQALTGYNYLANNPLISGTQTNAATTNNTATSNATANNPNAVAEANNAGAANNQVAQLLGTQPMTQQAQTGFNNYLNSTGYQFQQQQGNQAITGSAAARGLAGSGSTAKALTQYGQGLAGQSFNNYLSNLNTSATQNLNGANSQATNLNAITGQGLTSTGQVGSAGTTGGGNAGNLTAQGGAAMGNAITTAAGGLGSSVSSGNYNNFFGSI